jgi:hypothetical protein
MPVCARIRPVATKRQRFVFYYNDRSPKKKNDQHSSLTFVLAFQVQSVQRMPDLHESGLLQSKMFEIECTKSQARVHCATKSDRIEFREK